MPVPLVNQNQIVYQVAYTYYRPDGQAITIAAEIPAPEPGPGRISIAQQAEQVLRTMTDETLPADFAEEIAIAAVYLLP